MIKNQTFEMMGGNAKKLDVTVTDESGNLLDVTGAQIKWCLKISKDTTATLTKKDNGATGGISITNAAKGQFTISLTPSDTQSLDGVYYHDCELTDTSGNTVTIFSGNVIVTFNAQEV